MLVLAPLPVKRGSQGFGACKTSVMTTSDPDPAARLAASRAALTALAPRIRAGEPWPLAERCGAEPEASWGPREVLAHTAEMLPFWLGEYERVVEAGRRTGDGTPFGRGAADTLRIGGLERDRTLPLRELFDRIDAGIERWERRLAAAEGPDDDAVGVHGRLGEMTAGEPREGVVARPLQGHIRRPRG